jgi:hypothetical protein
LWDWLFYPDDDLDFDDDDHNDGAGYFDLDYHDRGRIVFNWRVECVRKFGRNRSRERVRDILGNQYRPLGLRGLGLRESRAVRRIGCRRSRCWLTLYGHREPHLGNSKGHFACHSRDGGVFDAI